MTATMNTVSNASPRKNLASQLDRLDRILDGLADGLNEAVAAAVKEAVGVAVEEAVKGLVAEVLANPELLAKLAGLLGAKAVPAANVPKPPAKLFKWTSRLARPACKVGAWFAAGWRS